MATSYYTTKPPRLVDAVCPFSQTFMPLSCAVGGGCRQDRCCRLVNTKRGATGTHAPPRRPCCGHAAARSSPPRGTLWIRARTQPGRPRKGSAPRSASPSSARPGGQRQKPVPWQAQRERQQQAASVPCMTHPCRSVRGAHEQHRQRTIRARKQPGRRAERTVLL